MYKVLLSFLFIVLTVSCHKALRDVQDYFPKIETVSATVQPDGTVLVTGEITSEGEAPVEYIGFCCGLMETPAMLDRQLLGGWYEDGKFAAVYEGDFDPDSVYYFRAWASNEYGYAYGNIVSLTHIIGTPVDPPCSLALNTCSIGGGQPTSSYTSVSEPDQGFNTWEITATGGSAPLVRLLFGSELTTGIYKTVDYNSPGAGQVYVSFYVGSIADHLNTGSDVYVERISSGVFEVTICDAPWFFTSGNPIYFNTRFRSPL